MKVNKDEDKNLLKEVFEIEDQYKFIKDEDIIDSFQKVFQDYNVVYKPHKKSKNIYVDDLIFSNKKISEFYCRSRKLKLYMYIHRS